MRSLFVSLLFALSIACAKPAPDPVRRPDVFLIVVDTLRADHLGCYGYPRPTSPNVDRLAAEGTLFEDATSQASWTRLSMVSMLQGHYVTDYRDVFEEKSPTLAELFHQAGYRTLGEVANILLPGESGFGRGFDHYDARGPSKDDKAQEDKPSDGLTRNAAVVFRDLGAEIDRARAVDVNRNRPPLFVYAHLMDPHYPYLRHREFDGELPLDGASSIPEGQREVFTRGGAPAPSEDPGWTNAWKGMAEARASYDQEIRFADAEIGRFLDRLRAQGLLDHAVVALVADHGEVLYEQVAMMPPAELAKSPPDSFYQREHGMFLFQSLVHTPFILWGEGVSKGVRAKDPVENVDLFPTLSDLAGLRAPGGLHGRSLAGRLRGETSSPREEVRAFVRQSAAVRELASNLKLTLPTEFGKTLGARPTLFSLSDDPAETRDLYGERPADAERLKQRITEWIRRYPTQSSLHRKKDAKEIGDLHKLGYTDEDKK